MANPLDAIEPDKVDKIIALILGVPGRILDSLFRLFESVNHPIEPRAKYICLLALAFGGIIICYRYRRNFISWFMGLYLLLIILSAAITLTIPIIDYIFPDKVKLKGIISIYSLAKAHPSDVISGDWRSNDCGINETREIQRCGPQGQPLSPPLNLQVTSANCGSNVENVKIDPSNSTCVLVRERLQGCGSERILGIKNCKGRGWLAYMITTASQAAEEKLVKSIDVNFTADTRSDIEIELPDDNKIDIINRLVKYKIELQVGNTKPIIISNESPADGSIMSDVLKSKLVIYRTSEYGDNKAVK